MKKANTKKLSKKSATDQLTKKMNPKKVKRKKKNIVIVLDPKAFPTERCEEYLESVIQQRYF